MRISLLILLSLSSLSGFSQSDSLPTVPIYDSIMFDDPHIDRFCNIERKRAMQDLQKNKLYFIEVLVDTPKYYRYMPQECKKYNFTYFFIPERILGFSGFNPMRCYMQRMDSAIEARNGQWAKESIIGAAQNVCAENDTPAEQYKTSEYDDALFSANQMASEILHPHVRKFTPTHAEVDKIEFLLRTDTSELKKQFRNFYKTIPLMASYRKQYFGYIGSNGHKIIYINSFWIDKTEPDEFSYWLQTDVAVNDGGEYFWRAEYDLTEGKFISFYTNGYA